MQNDTLAYDTLAFDSIDSRPLPKWLTDQKKGLTSVQPTQMVMKKDHTLEISMAVTLLFIFLTVIILTLYIIRKQKNKAS
jgi:disulfide bond formation protein DsbB